MPALVSSPASDSQPIGRSSRRFCCRLLCDLGRALQEVEHQPLQLVLVGGQIRCAGLRGASGPSGGETAPRSCQRRLQAVQQLLAPGRSRKGCESLPERSASSRLQNRSKRVRSAAGSSCAPAARSTLCSSRSSSKRAWNTLQLEFGGAVRRRWPAAAAGDARSGAGWRRTPGWRRSAEPRRGTERGRRRSYHFDRGQLPDRALAVDAVIELGILAPGVDHPERAALAHRQRLAVAVERQQDRIVPHFLHRDGRPRSR